MKEYQEQAERTIGEKQPRSLTLNQTRLLHGAITCSTETAEIIKDMFNHKKVLEECGDTLWGIAEICCAININIKHISSSRSSNSPFEDLVIHSAAINNVIKQHVFWDLELNTELLIQELANLKSTISIILNGDLKSAMELNIAKLNIRFPGTFNVKRALNRDTQKESLIFK